MEVLVHETVVNRVELLNVDLHNLRDFALAFRSFPQEFVELLKSGKPVFIRKVVGRRSTR